MREILFRGIIKSDNSRYKRGQWAVGDLVRLQDGNDGKPHIYGCGEVFADTVGQYTGLTDKNGKKIFEGDILQFKNDDGEFSLYSCEWGGEICGWVIRFLEYDAPCDAFDALFCMDAQVIGNIHDNPELLEVSGDDNT